MEVTENLWEYLHRNILHPDDGSERIWLWIDAICINQQDVEEQNAQVKRMRDIYGQSLGCNAWLGKASDDSDKAMDMLNAIAAQQVNSTAEATAYMANILADRCFWNRRVEGLVQSLMPPLQVTIMGYPRDCLESRFSRYFMWQ
jgi:hypothetical protein